MAAAHTDVLSSPPSKPQHAMSSSPGLPSVSEILAERIPRPLNQSRAKAKAVPDSTDVDFTSANRLPRKDVPQSLDATPHIAFTSNNRVAEKDCIERNEPDGVKVRRKMKRGSTTKSSGNMVNDKNSIGSGAKKRIKKPRKGDQTKITQAKVTKPSSGLNTLKKAYTEGFAAVNSRCTIDASIDNQRHTSVVYGEPDMGSIDAVPRRKDWTPVRDTSRVVINDCSILLPTGSPSPVKPADGVLLKHLGGYRLVGADQNVVSRPQPPCNSNGQATTKKRKLDLITGIATAVSKPTVTRRSRSPKKKPQTITDKATAPFIFEDQAPASIIPKYFSHSRQDPNPTTCISGYQKEASNEGNVKVDRSGKAKSSGPKAKKDKKVKELPTLHPPELAVNVANEQDLLFGTCSQLAKDESPTFIRDLQRAVKQSEAIDDIQPTSQLEGQESQVSIKSISSSSSITRLPAAVRNLWSVSARDDQGHLLDVDVVDLVNTPQALRSFSTKTDFSAIEMDQSLAVDNGWKTIEVPVIGKRATSQHLDQQEAEHALPRSVGEATLRTRPKSKSPVKKSRHQTNQEQVTVESDSSPEMPNYKGFTDVDLKKAVSATGFKVMRKREGRIAHLEECWHAAGNRRALNPLNISAPSIAANVGADESTKPSGAAKKRGRRPKKTSVSADEDGCVDTSAVSPQKPRGRPRKGASVTSRSSGTHIDVHSNPNPLGHSQLVDTAEPHIIPATSVRMKATQDIAPLLVTITDAVTKCPPTHDARNLTPYEKMLLYDPVVLEDLAQWLNEEGLKRVGCDETVDLKMAKLWCESQSVCCLSRENLRGGARPRY
ncbi:MAG: hypothetical protein Q9192_005956 [Flavoplaca navasiana]